MKRSQFFIVASLLSFAVMALLLFVLTKSLRKDNSVKMVNAEKEAGFRSEALVLDSLYTNYVTALRSGDQSAIAGAHAVLTGQFSTIKKQYAGTSSPAKLAAKLIRNYEIRVFLQQKKQERRMAEQGEVSRLNAVLKELEASNQDLKTQVQMVRQALLTVGP